MRKCFSLLAIFVLLVSLIFDGTFQVPAARAQDNQDNSKISSLLSIQVGVKLRTMEAAPLARDRSDIRQAVKATSTEVTLADKQRIFIHLNQELSTSQLEELEAMGLTVYLDSWIPPVKQHPTGFIIADMPLGKLPELARKDYITSLDTAERILKPHNDLAAQKINADDAWALGYDGTGVGIAVLDSGLDVTHNDIPAPTASKDYSQYPTLGDNITNQVTGHGTHVTGSALGRGTQSGGVYKGTAPGADLVFLKIGNNTSGSASTAAVVNAIKAAVDNYNADIITLSYGAWDSYHDGTSQEAQAVDYATSQGGVVFVAAGNSADDDQHYSNIVAASSNTSYIQVNVTGAGTNDTTLQFNLVWYDGTGTSNDLELEYYDSSYALLSSTNGAQSESSRGTESELSYYDLYVPPGNSTYYLRVKNNSTNSQFFHIYYDLGGSRVKFNNPDVNYTIESPANADSAIAVGAYSTRKTWYDFANNGWQWNFETVDQICTFSSRGPRVDTGAPPKPNIVAPGCGIISCRDDNVFQWANRDQFYIDNNGPNRSNAAGGSNNGNGPAEYYMMQGTSMASPLAASVAALILEKNPSWTPAQVRHALEYTATDKGASSHDNLYGWGLIDALSALTPGQLLDSYSDSAHTMALDNFSDYATVHMNSIGLYPSYAYRMAYYDGGNDKRATMDANSDASGNVSSQHTFVPGAETVGTWNVIVCAQMYTPPSTYSSSWP
ncbi:S8 family serine peptidase, partial [Chloroflexota bacterium]